MSKENRRSGCELNEAGSVIDRPTTESVFEPGRERLPDDITVAVLADSQRRRLLRHLDACGSTATMDDLAEEIAAREAETARAEVSTEERRRVTVKLHHVHVPKLRDGGIVEYDEKNGTVALTEKGQRIVRRFL